MASACFLASAPAAPFAASAFLFDDEGVVAASSFGSLEAAAVVRFPVVVSSFRLSAAAVRVRSRTARGEGSGSSSTAAAASGGSVPR